MKLALYLPNFRDKVTIKELEDLTALAEELDFDSVWTLDRIVVPEASDRQELQYSFGMMAEFPKALPVSARGEWFQGWPLIPWLAAKTSKVRIGMSITDTPYRAPGVLAAEIATVDHLCNGRINVGVGSGWMPEEFAASSAAHIFPKRHKHVRETIEIMKGIWTNELFEYHGEFADFDSCGFGAKPLQDPHPPIFFSGLKDPKRSASRIAKYDLSGWIGIQDTPTELQDWRGAIQRELDELGSSDAVRRPGDLLDDLVRDHRRGDRPDRRGQGHQPARRHGRADHRHAQAVQRGRPDDAVAVAAVRRRAGVQDARRPQAAEGGDHAEGRRDVMLRHFDHVVVGGGSAGCVLAARLSEDPAVSVLLLEAGPDWRSKEAFDEVRSMNPGTVITDARFAELRYPRLRARRTTEQEPAVLWRGRGMGGSSTVNGILAIRALPEDHDGWGLDGWRWADVLPCYRRLERDVDHPDDPWHGADGPLPIMRMPQHRWGAVDAALAAAADDAGYGWCADHNAPTGTGVSPYATNCDPIAEERVTTNDAYLEPARDRPNLTILGDSPVDRVLLDGATATGVRARIDGEWTEVECGEVILCAGAAHSPAILLRSGIGPGGPVVDLPVGEHLQDHPLCALVLPLRDDALPADPTQRHTNVCVRYTSGLAGAGRNDMMIIGMNIVPLGPYGMLGAWVNECWSEGTLTLASADPLRRPDRRRADARRRARPCADARRHPPAAGARRRGAGHGDHVRAGVPSVGRRADRRLDR